MEVNEEMNLSEFMDFIYFVWKQSGFCINNHVLSKKDREVAQDLALLCKKCLWELGEK